MYPIIFLSESTQIPVFYLVLSLVVCICLIWLNKRVRSQGLNAKVAFDTAFIVMLSSLLGSRLLHVVYENPEIYAANPIDIFYIWNGGFVFYGGALLAMLSGSVFVLLKDSKNLRLYYDLFAPICSLAYALGRWGCFFAGCCYGKFCDLPWAVANRHPTQIYASLWEFGTLSLLLAFEKKTKRVAGQVYFLWIGLHSIGRLMMESFRDDFRGPTVGLPISSWISIGLLIASLLGLIWSHRVSLKKS